MKFKVDEGGITPTRAHDDDAGIDLYTPERLVIHPRSRRHVDLKVRVEIPKNHVGLLTSKSGLMKNNGVTTRGTIDSGYSGRIGVTVFNDTDELVIIGKGMKITQLVVMPCIIDPVEVVDMIASGERGEDGFGSTDALYDGHRR